MITLLQIVQFLLNILWWIIIVQAVLSWLLAFNVISLSNDVVRSVWQGLNQLTEPIYRPIRKIMPDFGALDLTPMVVLFGIYFLSDIVIRNIIYSMYMG